MKTYQVQIQGRTEYQSDSLQDAERYAKTISSYRWGGRLIVATGGDVLSSWDNGKKGTA